MAYIPTGAPVAQNRGASVSIRNEFILIQQALNASGTPIVNAASLLNYAVDTGVVNAIVCTVNSNIVAYADGLELVVKVIAANTGATTINAGALGLKNVVRPDGTPLQLGDVALNQIILLRYDAIAGNFQLTLSSAINAVAAAASATSSAGSAVSAAASAAAAAAVAAPAVKIQAASNVFLSQNFGGF